MERSPRLSTQDSDQLNLLPDIKKPKSFSKSPKHSLGINMPGSPKPSNPFQQSEIGFIKNPDQLRKTQKRVSIKMTKKNSDFQSTIPKYSQLIKLIQEKDSYINSLEIQISDHQHICPAKSLAKVSSSTFSDENQESAENPKEMPNRYKRKEADFLDLKTENDDFKNVLESISSELNDYKAKLKESERYIEKVKKLLESTEKDLELKTQSIISLERKLKEKEMQLMYKDDEYADLNRLLKQSEDKRKVAVELTNNFEKKYFKLKSKQLSLKVTSKDHKISIEQLNSILEEKDLEIKDLRESLVSTEETLYSVQSEFSSLKTELEMLRVSKKTSTDLLESKLGIIAEENKYLKETLQEPRKAPTSISKRSETIIHSNFFSKLSNQELVKANKRLYEQEEKLMEKDFEIEKLKKDYSYLSTQLQNKDLIIKNMKKSINDGPHGSTDDLRKSIQISWIESQQLLDKTCKGLNDLLLGLQCSKCFGVNGDHYLMHPCGHFICGNCRDGLMICPKCLKKASINVPVSFVSTVVEFIEEGEKNLEGVKGNLNLIF